MTRSLSDRLVLTLATGLGLGWLPKAPGTFGSLLGLPLVWGLEQVETPWRWLIATAVIAIGVPICGRAAKLLNLADPGCVVYDEIAAFPVVFCAVTLNWWTALLGFALFRLFDVGKPWPVSRLEQLPGGLGIMADDIAAGGFAGVCLWGATKIVLTG